VSRNIRAEMQMVKVAKYYKGSDQLRAVWQKCKKEGRNRRSYCSII